MAQPFPSDNRGSFSMSQPLQQPSTSNKSTETSDQIFELVDEEKQVLSRLILELKYIFPMVSDAESLKNENVNLHFDYSKLKNDLNQIIGGLQQYIDTPQREPNVVEP